MKPNNEKQKREARTFHIISRRVAERYQVDESNITTPSHSDVKPELCIRDPTKAPRMFCFQDLNTETVTVSL